MNESDILRHTDLLLRSIAGAEHPPGASPLVLTFDDVGFAPDFLPEMRGFAARGLDVFAAGIRRDPSLVGRPVFAIAVDRMLAAGDPPSALLTAWMAALHELAHAVAMPPLEMMPADYRGWLRGTFARIADRLRDPSTHGPDWWKRLAVLHARFRTLTPSTEPLIGFEAPLYGYGPPSLAGDWLDAVQADDPGFLTRPLVDVAGRPSPRFDSMLARVQPTAETSSAAA